MHSARRRFWQGVRDLAGTWGVALVILCIGFFVAYQFVGPAPPRRIVMATGEEGGAYQYFGEKFAAVLARHGIEVELRKTAGSVENLNLLAANQDVDVAFVQGGLADLAPADNVLAIGALFLEPLWVFSRSNLKMKGLGDLIGKRVAVGPEGSGTRAVVLHLLDANGVDSQNAELLGLRTDSLPDAFASRAIDAAFVIGAPESRAVGSLTRLDGVELHNLTRADAYARRFPYLSKLTLPQGVLDLEANIPRQDLNTIALGGMLAVRKDLHPALVDLLLVAATEINGRHSLLSEAGQFPTPKLTDLPLSPEAERYFRYGPPFLLRYLPFWAATLVDRLWVMLLPLIGLAIPLAKLVPPAYRWQIRRRLLRLYSELRQIDPLGNAVRDRQDLEARLQRLERLESESAIQSVPSGYTDDFYKLRRDIDLVRRRLGTADGQIAADHPIR